MSKKIIILYAIYQEYGLSTFLKRIKKIYNIDIPFSVNATIMFLPESIIIQEDDIKYTLEFKEEYYQFIKDFTTYKTIKSYDNNHNLFRRSYLFKTSDNRILALDEIDDINMKSKRIIKTSPDDELLQNGEFERELLNLVRFPAVENYNFTNTIGFVHINKTINMPKCLYYYSYNSKTMIPDSESLFNILEVSCSTNTPKLDFSGRERAKSELLRSSIANKMPNIILRGTLLSRNKSLKCFYKITILKTDKGITIHYLSTDAHVNNKKNKVIVVPSLKGEFTSQEIDNIITAINNNLVIDFDIDFKQPSIPNAICLELKAIQNAILVNKNQKIRDVDILDYKLHQFDDINHLAFDIYENLSTYESIINKLLKITPTAPEETLKKS